MMASTAAAMAVLLMILSSKFSSGRLVDMATQDDGHPVAVITVRIARITRHYGHRYILTLDTRLIVIPVPMPVRTVMLAPLVFTPFAPFVLAPLVTAPVIVAMTPVVRHRGRAASKNGRTNCQSDQLRFHVVLLISSFVDPGPSWMSVDYAWSAEPLLNAKTFIRQLLVQRRSPVCTTANITA